MTCSSEQPSSLVSMPNLAAVLQIWLDNHITLHQHEACPDSPQCVNVSGACDQPGAVHRATVEAGMEQFAALAAAPHISPAAAPSPACRGPWQGSSKAHGRD